MQSIESLLRAGFVQNEWSALDTTSRGRVLEFGADVLRFNRVQNLISRTRPEQELAVLLEESICAALAVAHRRGGRWLDVGSGAGFPGIVLACVHPDQALDLVERRRGRCDFLERELAALGLSRARVVQADLSTLVEQRGACELVFAKAVAEFPSVLELCGPALMPSGGLVLFQGADWGVVGAQLVDRWSIERSWPGWRDASGRVRRSGYLLTRTNEGPRVGASG